MSYLDWLEANWKQGRPYLHRVAILDSAQKRLADEESEIARLEAGESVEKPSLLNMDPFGFGRIMEELAEGHLSRMEVNLLGGNLDEVVERRRIEKWERQAVEAAERNRLLASVKRESLYRWHKKPVDDALQERDACIFDNYPKRWSGMDVDELGSQLTDRYWALGWLDSPVHHAICELDDVFLWFMNDEDWNASIETYHYRHVVRLSAPLYREELRKQYRSVTRCGRLDDITKLLQRTMLTFVDLNFDRLRRDLSFNDSIERFKSRIIEDWPQ